MASNAVQEGEVLKLTLTNGATSNDPIQVGEISGVAIYTTSAGGACTVDTKKGKVWDVSVKAIDTAGDAAVAIGDKIYHSTADSPVLTKKPSGKHWGESLEVITAGDTQTVNVRCKG